VASIALVPGFAGEDWPTLSVSIGLACGGQAKRRLHLEASIKTQSRQSSGLCAEK